MLTKYEKIMDEFKLESLVFAHLKLNSQFNCWSHLIFIILPLKKEKKFL